MTNLSTCESFRRRHNCTEPSRVHSSTLATPTTTSEECDNEAHAVVFLPLTRDRPAS